MVKIKTYVFLGMETTGLPEEENNKTKNSEICLIAVSANHLLEGRVPRIQNKLILCVKPGRDISEVAKGISQIQNEDVSDIPSFSGQTITAIEKFLELLEGPWCFLAHYGSGFHFRILKREIQEYGASSLITNALVVDTLPALRALYPGLESYKLKDLYGPITGKPLDENPTSEKRLIMLMECVAACASRFEEWVHRNLQTLSAINSL